VTYTISKAVVETNYGVIKMPNVKAKI